MRIRVGVIGVGQMGRHHARIYSSMPDVELVGVSDLNRTNAEDVAKRYGTTAYSDPLKLIQEVDAVSIAVPTSVHKDIAVEVADFGVNMLIEKPIADSIKNAKEIVGAVRKAGVKAMVGHIERFNPAIRRLKNELTSLGDVLCMSGRRVGPYSPRIRDVGVIVDLAVHEIDTMSYLYEDRAMSVYAVGGKSKRFPHEFEDYASIILRYRGNRSGVIETNWLTSKKIRTLTVVGTDAVASVDYIRKSLEIFRNGDRINLNVDDVEPLKCELRHFIDAIKYDFDPTPSVVDGLYVLHVALSAIRSYKGDKMIELVI